jgi:NAD-dependent deacetylase
MTPRLRDFERIVFFTGAGLSSESGIPTYRGAGGIWKEYNYED